MPTEPGQPRISAVIPAYDREGTVGRAIESVLAQTRAPLELIVVDDGSTDGTRAVIEGFGDAVRPLFQANAGASAARNAGVAAARGDWIAFLDSDDHWLPAHLEHSARAIHATGGAADVYFSDMRRAEDEDGRRLWDLCGLAAAGPHELRADGTDWAMLPRQPMMLQSSVLRREAYLAAGGLDERLPSRHDTHLFLLLCLGRPTCAVADVATQMTCDDTSGGRVTALFDGRSLAYAEETVLLYSDVLARAGRLPERHRRELAARLAAAHLRLARGAWSRGRKGACAAHLSRAARTSPARLLSAVSRRVLRKGA